jgi:hypothetical protein
MLVGRDKPCCTNMSVSLSRTRLPAGGRNPGLLDEVFELQFLAPGERFIGELIRAGAAVEYPPQAKRNRLPWLSGCSWRNGSMVCRESGTMFGSFIFMRAAAMHLPRTGGIDHNARLPVGLAEHRPHLCARSSAG